MARPGTGSSAPSVWCDDGVPSRAVIRRRRLGAAAGALAALAAGAAVGAGAGDPASPSPPERPGPGAPAARAPGAAPDALAAVRRLPLEQRVGTLIIMRFAGTAPPAYVERALRRRRSAGVILFTDNITTEAALVSMTGRLQRAAGGDGIISTDQEGGAVRRIVFSEPVSGQGALGTPAAARAAARAAGRDLRRLGLNLNLAPVADVSTVPGSVVAGRAYPGDTAAVARLVRAGVEGYRGTGVAPTLKHFPGIGGTATNTDDAPARIDRPAEELGAVDLPPFRAGIAAGAPAVMLSHGRYPALDASRIASQSPAVVALLRDDLRFGGVIMTDSLEAAAVRATGSPETASIASVAAGVDVILTTGRGSHIRVLRALLAEARRSRSFRARVTEAAARVLELRRALARARSAKISPHSTGGAGE